MTPQENFNETYRLYDIMCKYDKNTLSAHSMIDAFAKWLIGEESSAYLEAKDSPITLDDQIMEDIRAQDDEQIRQVCAWLQGYLTAKNINF